MGHLGPKRGQNDAVLGHSLVQNTLVFGNFAQYDQ